MRAPDGLNPKPCKSVFSGMTAKLEVGRPTLAKRHFNFRNGDDTSENRCGDYRPPSFTLRLTLEFELLGSASIRYPKAEH